MQTVPHLSPTANSVNCSLPNRVSTLSNLSVELSVDLLDFLEIFLTDRQTDLTLTLLIFWCPRIPAKSVCLLAKTTFYFLWGLPQCHIRDLRGQNIKNSLREELSMFYRW